MCVCLLESEGMPTFSLPASNTLYTHVGLGEGEDARVTEYQACRPDNVGET